MAKPNGAVSTGAGKDDADLRRRNVQSSQTPNGGTGDKVEAEDTKKLQKVHSLDFGVVFSLFEAMLMC
jgi:hypothetical protein